MYISRTVFLLYSLVQYPLCINQFYHSNVTKQFSSDLVERETDGAKHIIYHLIFLNSMYCKYGGV